MKLLADVRAAEDAEFASMKIPQEPIRAGGPGGGPGLEPGPIPTSVELRPSHVIGTSRLPPLKDR